MVVIKCLFGEVKELCMLDMGLGTCQRDFETMSDDEYEDWLWEDEEMVQDMEVLEVLDDDSEEANILIMGVGQPGMGNR